MNTEPYDRRRTRILYLFVLLNFSNITNISLGYDYTVSSPEELRIVKLLLGIILLVIFAFYLCAGILLIYSVRNEGENFYKSQAVFIAGLVLTVLCGPLSISSVLLYISLTIYNPKPELAHSSLLFCLAEGLND